MATSELPALRVVYADDGPDSSAKTTRDRGVGKLSPRMTLVEFFWEHAWPHCLETKRDCPRTRDDYVTSLAYWKRFTGDPPIGEIDKRTLAAFMRQVGGLPGKYGDISPTTIRKHWSNIQRLIEWTGPESRANPNGTNLVSTPAYVPAPRRRRGPPKPGFSLDQLWDWLCILPSAARPIPGIDCDPVHWWRALILVAYNTGMRPRTLFHIRWEMIGEPADLRLRDRGRVIRVPESILKGDRGRLLWLNRPALDALGPLEQRAGLVFRWPDWPRAESTLRKHRVRLQRAAGIPTQWRSLYAFRRTFTTECGKINAVAMQLMTGHEGLGIRMATEHYINAESLLAEALSRLPQPGCVRQRMLW